MFVKISIQFTMGKLREGIVSRKGIIGGCFFSHRDMEPGPAYPLPHDVKMSIPQRLQGMQKEKEVSFFPLLTGAFS